MSTQMDKLLAQQAKAQQKLHKAKMDDKKIKKQIADCVVPTLPLLSLIP